MFGYVNILKDELKIKDYNTFRAYYCCLCKTLGRHNGVVSRFGLSYDMTFLLILLAAVADEEFSFSDERCIAHPLTQHKTAAQNEISEYVADISCMLVYLKCKDDWDDEHSIKGLFGMAAYRSCIRRAKKRYPDIYKTITKKLGELSALEKEASAEVDRVSDCFAKITEALFSYKADGDMHRILSWIGYNIGRWIYIIDAFCDIDKDLKEKSYNPLVERYGADDKEKIAAELEVSLTLTLANIASAYELLDIKRNNEILKNILYDGLLQKQQSILHKRKDTDNESL